MQNKSFCAFCRVLALYFSKFLAPLLQLQGSHLCARAFRKKDVVPKLLLLAPDRFPALAHHGFTSTLGSGKWIPSLSHYTACTKPARCLVGWMKDVHCKVASAWHLLQKTCMKLRLQRKNMLEPKHYVKLCNVIYVLQCKLRLGTGQGLGRKDYVSVSDIQL